MLYLRFKFLSRERHYDGLDAVVGTSFVLSSVMKVKRKSYSLTHKDKFLVDVAVNTSASSENLDRSSQREGMICGSPYLCRSHLLTLVGE